jgi:hypothetical protein
MGDNFEKKTDVDIRIINFAKKFNNIRLVANNDFYVV